MCWVGWCDDRLRLPLDNLELPESSSDLLNPHQTIALHHSQWAVNFIRRGKISPIKTKYATNQNSSVFAHCASIFPMDGSGLTDRPLRHVSCFFLVALRPDSGPWSSLTGLRDYTYWTHPTR
jgi:hypothetical protein